MRGASGPSARLQFAYAPGSLWSGVLSENLHSRQHGAMSLLRSSSGNWFIMPSTASRPNTYPHLYTTTNVHDVSIDNSQASCAGLRVSKLPHPTRPRAPTLPSSFVPSSDRVAGYHKRECFSARSILRITTAQNTPPLRV